MFYTYVLKSEKSGRFYTGFTSNLRKRLKQHNNGESYYTNREKPYLLVYYEASLNEDDARAREIYLKTGMGKRFIKNRIKNFQLKSGMIPLETAIALCK